MMTRKRTSCQLSHVSGTHPREVSSVGGQQEGNSRVREVPAQGGRQGGDASEPRRSPPASGEGDVEERHV